MKNNNVITVLNISCVTQFLTSITVREAQNCDNRHLT